MIKMCIFAASNANVAQLVEHQLPKLRVAGSNPVIRSWDLNIQGERGCEVTLFILLILRVFIKTITMFSFLIDGQK